MVKKSWKRISFFVVIMMFFGMFGTSVRTRAAELDNEVKYVSLGDSVAYGLSAPSQQGYAKMFNTYLNAVKKPGTTVTFADLGVSGYTTNDLLNDIIGNPETQADLFGADVITINIGSNNLLSSMVGAVLVSYGYDPKELNYDLMLQLMKDKLKETKYDMTKMMAPYKALALNADLIAKLEYGVQVFKGQ